MKDPQASRHAVDKRLVAAAFNAAAKRYDRHAVLQSTVRERLLERLDVIRIDPGRVLDVGAGTGAASRALAKKYRQAEVIGVDLAFEMLQVGRDRRLLRRARRQDVCADAEALPFTHASAELVFSNLTMQWCNELDAVMQECQRVLRPGGLLLFSTLGPDTLSELRASWAQVDDHTHVNVFIDMHDVGDALIRAGFGGPVMDVENITLTYATVEDLLRDLKAIGAHNVTAARARGLTGKRALGLLRDAYERFRVDGRLPATYEVVYGHAWRPDADARVQDGSTVTQFPAEEMRAALRQRRPVGR